MTLQRNGIVNQIERSQAKQRELQRALNDLDRRDEREIVEYDRALAALTESRSLVAL